MVNIDDGVTYTPPCDTTTQTEIKLDQTLNDGSAGAKISPTNLGDLLLQVSAVWFVQLRVVV